MLLLGEHLQLSENLAGKSHSYCAQPESATLMLWLTNPEQRHSDAFESGQLMGLGSEFVQRGEGMQIVSSVTSNCIQTESAEQ